MHSGSPLGATRLLGPFGQAVNGRIARRNLISFRANVVSIGSHKGELASEPKLQVAFGQGPLCLLALTNIDGHVDDTDDSTCTITKRCRIRHDGDASTVSALKDRLPSAHHPPLS